MPNHQPLPTMSASPSPLALHHAAFPPPKPQNLAALDGHLTTHEVTIRAIVHLKDQEIQALARGDHAVAALFRELHQQKEQPIYNAVTATFPKDDASLVTLFRENAFYYGHHGMRELERGYLQGAQRLVEKARKERLALFRGHEIHENDQYQAPLVPRLPILGPDAAVLQQQNNPPIPRIVYQFINFTKADFQTPHHHKYFDREGSLELVAAQAQDEDHDPEFAGCLDFVVKIADKKDADDGEEDDDAVEGSEMDDEDSGHWTVTDWV